MPCKCGSAFVPLFNLDSKIFNWRTAVLAQLALHLFTDGTDLCLSICHVGHRKQRDGRRQTAKNMTPDKIAKDDLSPRVAGKHYGHAAIVFLLQVLSLIEL